MPDKIAQEFAVSKVVARACQWFDRRNETRALKNGPQRDRVRALGRYEVAGEALAESVQELRKTEATEAHHG